MRRSLPLFALLLADRPPAASPAISARRRASPSSCRTPRPTSPRHEFERRRSARRRRPAGRRPQCRPDRGARRRLQLSLRLPPRRAAHRRGAGAARPDVRAADVARCRITGMYYRVVNDRDIEAMLAFKLDPALARLFGRQGVEAVVRAEGMLTESEISGTDVGTAIRAAGRSLAELQADLARIEARLARRDPVAASARASNMKRSSCASRSARSATAAASSRNRWRRRRWCSATARATSSPASPSGRRSGRRCSAPPTISSTGRRCC